MAVFDRLRNYLDEHDLSTITTNNAYIYPAPSPPIGDPAYLELNFTESEEMDLVIDQMLAAMNMFGFVGVRWDCGHLNTGEIWGQWRSFVDFEGQPLCSSPRRWSPRPSAISSSSRPPRGQ